MSNENIYDKFRCGCSLCTTAKVLTNIIKNDYTIFIFAGFIFQILYGFVYCNVMICIFGYMNLMMIPIYYQTFLSENRKPYNLFGIFLVILCFTVQILYALSAISKIYI